jgi:hypothetical protein
MSDIGQELEMLKRRAVSAQRTGQRPPTSFTKKQKRNYAAIHKVIEIDLKKADPYELVTDEFLETADDYEDELTAYELQSYVDSILSSVDVCVCNNAFVIPVDKREIPEDYVGNAADNNRGHKFTYEQETFMEELARRKELKRKAKEKSDAAARHLEACHKYQARRKAYNLKRALLKDYAFRRFPNKDRRRASGMKYAVVYNNQPIRETNSTVIYFKTLREAKAARANLLLKHGFQPEDIEILKTFGKDNI